MNYIQNKLIDTGIEKLRRFGFIYVNKKNIFEDDVYKYHFKKFMSVMLGQNKEQDAAINELFSALDKPYK